MATKAEDVAKAIMASIKGHTHVHDASHLVVDAKTTGFMFWKTTEIHVSGRVETEREKEVIDKIIETESAGFTVDNKLRVERR
jgi:hypothetical protein